MKATKKILAVSWLLIVCYGSAFAQPKWNKEPETIFGVKLGAKATDGSIVECNEIYGPDAKLERQPCYWQRGRQNTDTKLEIINLPFEDIYSGSINLDSGIVSSVTFDFKTIQFQTVLSIFKEKYGNPTTMTTVTMRNLAGAELPTVIVKWVGKKNSIALYERMGTVNDAYALISNNAAERKAAEAEALKRKEAAAKM